MAILQKSKFTLDSKKEIFVCKMKGDGVVDTLFLVCQQPRPIVTSYMV